MNKKKHKHELYVRKYLCPWCFAQKQFQLKNKYITDDQ